jgi:UDP-N-acetylmuramate dehydrogenase
MNWLKKLEGKVRLNAPLKKYSYLKIGGKADFFVEPESVKDLQYLCLASQKNRLPVYLLGCGSNILISDKGVTGLVIRLKAPCFKKIRVIGNFIEAGAGLELSRLIRVAQGASLSGSECLAGIPGTLGGALVMNAGKSGDREVIGNFVENVTVMDYNGKIRIISKHSAKFTYRSSGLDKFIVISVKLKLLKADRAGALLRLNDYLKYRRVCHDYSYPSLGCVFKNPRRESAGKLIDSCGLKGTRIGGAVISSKHANFIMNTGNASSSDYFELIRLVRQKVEKKFNLKLTPEIRLWGTFK